MSMPKTKTAVLPKKRNAVPNYYGWVPDLPDHRDYLYSVVRPVPPSLPPRVDLRPSCSGVEDQKDLGSCTANALVGALEFLEKKDRVRFVDLSWLFLYYNERVIEHSVKSDSGAQIRDGIKTLAKQGVCVEKTWPYVVSRFAVKPSATCYKEASDHQITSYHRILTLDEMRTCLSEGIPLSSASPCTKTSSLSRSRRPAWWTCRSPPSAWSAVMRSWPWATTMRERDSLCETPGDRSGA
jgi:hypothetical protein